METFFYIILRDFFINLICYRVGRLTIALATFGKVIPRKLSASQVEFNASSFWICLIGFMTLMIPAFAVIAIQ